MELSQYLLIRSAVIAARGVVLVPILAVTTLHAGDVVIDGLGEVDRIGLPGFYSGVGSVLVIGHVGVDDVSVHI